MYTDGEKAMHKSPPCISTCVLKNGAKCDSGAHSLALICGRNHRPLSRGVIGLVAHICPFVTYHPAESIFCLDLMCDINVRHDITESVGHRRYIKVVPHTCRKTKNKKRQKPIPAFYNSYLQFE